MQPQTPPPFDPRNLQGTPPQPQTFAPQTSGQNQTAPLPPNNPYEFIVNPAPIKSPLFFGGGSMAKKLLVFGGGLLILLIIGAFVSSLLKGHDKAYPAMYTVAQEQQELIHLTTDDVTSQQQTMSTSNANFAATASLAIATSQAQILSYLKQNGYKYNPKLLTSKESAALDQQLTAAVSSGTFDSTYQSILQTQLNSYGQALQQAYLLVTGPKGRALIKSDYNQAQLLQTQLNSPSS